MWHSISVLTPFLFTLSIHFCKGELISIVNQTHAICLNDDMYSALYINPPVVENATSSSILIQDSSMWTDGWLLKSSKDIITTTVTDKRFEDFATIFTDRITSDSAQSLAFSTTARNLTVLTSTPSTEINDTVLNKKRDLTDVVWQHTVIHSTDLVSLLNYEITSNNGPEFFKIHDYQVRWANTISVSPTTLLLSPEKVPCLMLYAFVCSNCSMDITVNSKKHTVSGQSNNNDHENWRVLGVEVESLTNIKFERKTRNGDENGIWALDIRRCPSTVSHRTINTFTFNGNSSANADRMCYLLSEPHKIPKENNSDIFQCDIGVLGKQCDVNCEDFLGPDRKYCEGYKLCESSISLSRCLCSWGYQGSECSQSCEPGVWGLSCQKACQKCSSCNKFTGECNFGSINFKKELLGIFLIVALIISRF